MLVRVCLAIQLPGEIGPRVATRANASCASSRAGGNPGPYILTVNGENVGGCGCLPSLDSSAALGHTLRVDLRGFLAPPGSGSTPLRGGVSNTPDQAPPAAQPTPATQPSLVAPPVAAGGMTATQAVECVADQTLNNAVRSMCAGVAESLGVGAAAVCAVPLLLVTVACPPS